MAKQKMVSNTCGIGQLLNVRRYFEVPPHQRDYAWPLGSVEQFLSDIVSSMEDADADYFLGLIVLVATDNPAKRRYQILDGQQRLATTTMVYAAIRQWLGDNREDTEANKIQNEFIGISEIGESQDEPRVILNTYNQDLFLECVINPISDKDLAKKQAECKRHSSNRKLVEAAIQCREFVGEITAKQGDDPAAQSDVLFRLAKFIRDHVQVNCLDVTSPENAYTIFESLNDRGIDLSVLDLLKNHLLREAGSFESQILHNWNQMITRLGDRRADDFLKAYWTSRFGRIQRGRLFRELKKKFNTKQQALTLSKDLSTLAETYANLEVADSDVWKGFSEAAREHVRALALLGARQTHPVILSGLGRFKTKQVESLLRHLVVLILRYQLIGRGRTGRLEIVSARASQAIYDRKLKTPASVWEDMKQIVPPNDEFQEDFSKFGETKPARARWLLRELEIQAWRGQNPTKALQHAPVADPEKVNLEHILPRNAGTHWSAVTKADPELLSDCRNRLGNLCLLDKPSNKKQAAKGYAFKKSLYAQSDFLLTAEIALTNDKWDRSSIEERQKKLAKLALLAWPA